MRKQGDVTVTCHHRYETARRSSVRLHPGVRPTPALSIQWPHEARPAGHRFLREKGIDGPDNEGQSQQRCSRYNGFRDCSVLSG